LVSELLETNQHPGFAAAAPDPSDNLAPLFEQIAETVERHPETALYRSADVQMWLQQTWPEPVLPHSPAWRSVIEGRISPQELVALMLAVWADTSIKYPPRYLSWLIQRWQTLPELPPAENWERWLQLAQLPLSEWRNQGREQWFELAPRDNRSLPFGLDAILEGGVGETLPTQPPGGYPATLSLEGSKNASSAEGCGSDGLDDHLGDDSLTVRDIWRATLGQLSVQLNRSTYTSWVEGAQAVTYRDGVLTVKAKHRMARDVLAQRLNYSIEKTASAMAQRPLTVHYVADLPGVAAAVAPSMEQSHALSEGEKRLQSKESVPTGESAPRSN